jgi:2-phospho-L-lactate/phosphoenolpyruvate guanylyltransferase
MDRPREQAGARPVVALVPLRTGGKSRLGASLPPGARDALVLAMLDDVVASLRGAGITDVRVLAGGAKAAAAAAARGLPAIVDPPTIVADSGAPIEGDTALRAAVDAALAALPVTSVRIIAAADLPRLGAAEVAAVLADPADVVIAPTAGGGTALLRIAPGVSLPARYGPGSAGAHLAAAEAGGLSVTVLDLPGARHDVDAADDLAALMGPLDGTSPGPGTTAFLAEVPG